MMASSKHVIEKITNAEIAGVNIATLADRPNSSSRYGFGDFSAQKLKERFDAFPKLVQERLNEIISALSNPMAAAYIVLDGSIGGVDNLYDFLALFCDKVAGENNISDYISALYTKLNESEPTSNTLQQIVDDMAWHISDINTDLDDHDGRIKKAEQLSQDHKERLSSIEEYVSDANATDASVDNIKIVPEKSRDAANVLSVGGMSYKSKNLVDVGTVTFEREKKFEASLEAGKTYYISTRITSNDTNTTNNQIDMTYEDGTHFYLAFSRDTRYKVKFTPTKKVISMTLFAGNNYPLSAGDTATYEDFMVCEEDTDVYEPFFAGLRHTKVTNVESRGANLIPFPYKSRSGDMGAGYTTTINGITFTVLDDGRIMANGTAAANARLSIVRNFLLPKGVFGITGGVLVDGAKDKAYVVVTAGLNGNWVAEKYSIGGKLDLTAYECDSNDIYLYVASGTTLNNVIFEPMVTFYQEPPAPYKPYRADNPIDALAIPASVQALDGYGVGVNADYYNHIEFADGKVFVQKCGEIIFNGTENWILQSVNSYGIANFQFNPVQKPTSTVRAICSDREYDSSLIANATKRGILNNDQAIFIRDDVYKTVAEWKAHLAERYASGNPLVAVYVFATPIETDITHLFTDVKPLTVEKCGYLTFVNEHGYAVPNTVEWRIESSHRVAFEHSQTKGNPHETTAAEVGAYSKQEIDEKLYEYLPAPGGKIPSSYLPSYVDDAVEGTLDEENNTFYPSEGYEGEVDVGGKIYIDINTNKSYRWTGSAYREISKSLSLGETEGTAFDGKRGKEAYDHSKIAEGNPHGTKIEDTMDLSGAWDESFLRVRNGKVITDSLHDYDFPGYIDDVLDGKMNADLTAFTPDESVVDSINQDGTIIPMKGKIYLDTETNRSYRWSGSQFVALSSAALPEVTASDDGKILKVVGGDWSAEDNVAEQADKAYQIVTLGGTNLKLFVGTQAEYDALSDKSNVFALITDDKTKDEIMNAISALETWKSKVDAGTHVVPKAEYANTAHAADMLVVEDSHYFAEVKADGDAPYIPIAAYVGCMYFVSASFDGGATLNTFVVRASSLFNSRSNVDRTGRYVSISTVGDLSFWAGTSKVDVTNVYVRKI